MATESPEISTPVTRRELEELRRNIKRSWQELLWRMAAASVGVELGAPAREASVEPERAPQENLAALLERFQAIKKEGEEEEAIETPFDNLTLAFWIFALLFYGFGDTLSSQLVMAVGGKEANPLLAAAMKLGGGIWAFSLMKSAILAALLFLSAVLGKLGRAIPAILALVGFIFTIMNLREWVGIIAG